MRAIANLPMKTSFGWADMVRKLIFLAALVGTAASVPMIYQSSPETYQELVASFFRDEEPAAVASTPSGARLSRLEASGETAVLAGKKVSITPDARGHFMGQFKMNGREITALIDTGATYIAMNKATASRIGIRLSPSDFKYTVSTANGQTKAASARIDTVQIGRIYLDNVEAVVLSDSALDGVLVGMSFMKRLGRFQVQNGALVLEQ